MARLNLSVAGKERSGAVTRIGRTRKSCKPTKAIASAVAKATPAVCGCGVCRCCVEKERVEEERFARFLDPEYYTRSAFRWESSLRGGEATIAPVM